MTNTALCGYLYCALFDDGPDEQTSALAALVGEPIELQKDG